MNRTPPREGVLDWRARGFPALEEPLPARDVAAQGWSLFDGRFLLPTMVLRESALAHDIATLASWTQERGVSFAPHGKTTMAPAIWQRQLDAGAWAISLATVWQARVAAHFGVPRVLLANEVVDPAGIAWLASCLRAGTPEIIVQVDSLAGAELLAAGLGSPGRRLPVLVEVGLHGNRAGSRTVEEALRVARRVAGMPSLVLAGVSFFEGTVGGATREERVAAVRRLTDLARAVTREVEPLVRDDGGTEVVLSGGGSAYVDTVVEELTQPLDVTLPLHVVVRSGAVVTHDHGAYEAESPFGSRAAPGEVRLVPALEVWAPVLSVPEPGLAILLAGKRDLSHDAGLPLVLAVRGTDGRIRVPEEGAVTLTKLNDQHAYVAFRAAAPAAELRVGELLAMGVAHPCTAFDRWRWLPVVDDDYRVIDAYELYF